jgi:hypothetical protein
MGEHLDAPELNAAVDAARLICTRHPGAHPGRFEVWKGTSRVFRRLDPVGSAPQSQH